MIDLPSALTRLSAMVRRATVRDAPAPEPPEPHRYASDLLQPQSAWPLVYVTDISGWAEERGSGAVSFALAHGMRYANDATTFQCKMPFADGDLFAKRGTYLVCILPATSQEQVDHFLRAARKVVKERPE
jgi:hypothetical protein